MLAVISPAKKLDVESPVSVEYTTECNLLDQAEILIERCRQLTPDQIATLMKLSDKLAGLNAARFGDWQLPFTPDNAKPALYAFQGDVYVGLDAESLTPPAVDFAQQHLRILSGLYGLLRPLDLMQAYRLEMGTKLDNVRGKDLYAFWGDRITAELNQVLAEQDSKVLVNLASTEYFKSVKPKALNAEIITPVFKDWKGDKYKIISFYAKKARGMMVRYIIDNQLTEPEQLKGFDTDGYQYNEAMSQGNEMVFTRGC